MNTLGDVEQLALNLMNEEFMVKDIIGEEHVLSATDLGYYFGWSNAKRRNGSISYSYKKISLSRPTVKENLHQVDGPIKNTILHEIAHAISYHLYGRDGRGHGYKWRSIAEQIGCSGERCTSDYKKPKGKYTLVCDNCGKEAQIYRRPKHRKSCGDCDTKFNPKYELKVVQNY